MYLFVCLYICFYLCRSHWLLESHSSPSIIDIPFHWKGVIVLCIVIFFFLEASVMRFFSALVMVNGFFPPLALFPVYHNHFVGFQFVWMRFLLEIRSRSPLGIFHHRKLGICPEVRGKFQRVLSIQCCFVHFPANSSQVVRWRFPGEVIYYCTLNSQRGRYVLGAHSTNNARTVEYLFVTFLKRKVYFLILFSPTMCALLVAFENPQACVITHRTILGKFCAYIFFATRFMSACLMRRRRFYSCSVKSTHFLQIHAVGCCNIDHRDHSHRPRAVGVATNFTPLYINPLP